jgi:hypothetical protein
LELHEMTRKYGGVLVDVGTGDGRFVDAMARRHPEMLAVGLDASREPLAERSRRAPGNALYLIGNALDLPNDLDGVASWMTLNFPWGSLLEALLAGDAGLLTRLAVIAQPEALIEVRVNGAAAVSCGVSLEEAGVHIRGALSGAGFRVGRPRGLCAADLRAFPSTWAHRLAFGTDPRACMLKGQRLGRVVADSAGREALTG